MEDNKKRLGEEYNRDLFDDVGRRNSRKYSFKNRQFQNRKTTIDRYTGEKIYYNKRKNTSKTSNVDHITPIKKVYDRHKNNKFITPTDVKDIVNDDKNLCIVSEAFNKYKKDKTNFQCITEKIKDKKKIESNVGRMINDQFKSEIYIEKEIAKRTINKASEIFKEGANKSIKEIKSTKALNILLIASVENMCLVASGEKDLKEATKDTCKIVGTSSVTSILMGGSKEVFEYAMDEKAKDVLYSTLSKLNNTLIITQIVSLGFNITESAVLYLDGSISEEEFFIRMSQSGLSIIAGLVGGSVGVALMIGAMIISNVYMNIYNIFKSIDVHKTRLREVNNIVDNAIKELKHQNSNIENIIKNYNYNYDKEIKLAFEEIYQSAINNDIDTFSNGLNTILNIFKKEVRFKNYNEFDDFFMNENSIFTL